MLAILNFPLCTDPRYKNLQGPSQGEQKPFALIGEFIECKAKGFLKAGDRVIVLKIKTCSS